MHVKQDRGNPLIAHQPDLNSVGAHIIAPETQCHRLQLMLRPNDTLLFVTRR
jgi:hypothetical protein